MKPLEVNTDGHLHQNIIYFARALRRADDTRRVEVLGAPGVQLHAVAHRKQVFILRAVRVDHEKLLARLHQPRRTLVANLVEVAHVVVVRTHDHALCIFRPGER